MELLNESNLEVGWTVGKLLPSEFSLTVVVKGTFTIRSGEAVTLAPVQTPVTGDDYEEGDPTKLLWYPSDLAPFKPKADLIVVGHCHAENGKPVNRLPVSFRVGGLSKTLIVTGDRVWERNGRASAPIEFTQLPLSWARSFGGSDFVRNPFGRGTVDLPGSNGSKVRPLPNVESPTSLLTDRSQVLIPAGCGPIPDTWPQRLAKFGGMGRNYLKERWPWYPENIDWGFFNAAPEDQQIDGYLKGDEDLVFEHLHPVHSRLVSRLPGLRVRCVLEERIHAREHLREIPLHLDTLWVQPETEKLVLVWRGHAAVRSEKLAGIEHLLVVTETMDSAPATLSDLGQVLDYAITRGESDDDELEPEEEPDEEEEEQIDAPAVEEAVPSAVSGETVSAPESGAASALALSDSAGSTPPEDEEPEEEEPEEPEVDEDEFTVERVAQKLARNESLAGCDLSALDLTGMDFSGADLRETILTGCALVRCVLTKANLSGAVLTGANLREVTAAEANFEGADLTSCWFYRADLKTADFTGADLSKARLREANFSGAILSDAILEQADLTDARFAGAQLSGADLSMTRLHRTDFTGANLAEVGFERAWGRGTKARGAILHKVRAANSIFCEADFQEIEAEDAVWQSAQLCRVDFSGAQLLRAEFSEAYLHGANLSAAELKQACFDEAKLKGAHAKRANFFAASLDKADLSEADFSEANLYGASLMDTVCQQTGFVGANLHQIKTKNALS